MAVALVPAAGAGTRLAAALPKYLAPLAGQPLLAYALLRLAAAAAVERIVIAVPADEVERCRELVGRVIPGTATLVAVGGATRQESVACALAAAAVADEAIVLVHDAARPLVTGAEIEAVVSAAERFGAAIVAAPVVDTLKRERPDAAAAVPWIAATVSRQGLWAAKTPQACRAGLLRRAIAEAVRDGFTGTDEASLLERLGEPVALVPASPFNLKVTYPADVAFAELLVGAGL